MRNEKESYNMGQKRLGYNSTQLRQEDELQIKWLEHHNEFILRQFAQFYSPSEASDNCLREFADEFNIMLETKEESAERARLIRRFIYAKARYLAYDKYALELRLEKVTDYRKEFFDDVEKFIPEANKSVRLRRLRDISLRAEREGDRQSAIRALLAIDLMTRNWNPNLYLNQNNTTINQTVTNINLLTDEQARANLQRLLEPVPEQGLEKTNGKGNKGSNGTH